MLTSSCQPFSSLLLTCHCLIQEEKKHKACCNLSPRSSICLQTGFFLSCQCSSSSFASAAFLGCPRSAGELPGPQQQHALGPQAASQEWFCPHENLQGSLCEVAWSLFRARLSWYPTGTSSRAKVAVGWCLGVAIPASRRREGQRDSPGGHHMGSSREQRAA